MAASKEEEERVSISRGSITVESGVALIKPEFIISDHERVLTLECISDVDKKKLENAGIKQKIDDVVDRGDEARPWKKPRLSKQKKKKLRGQNKARPLPYKFDSLKHLCRTLTNIGEEEVVPRCDNEKCCFLHDINEYLAIKPPDIGPVCYVYSLRGQCERGVTCRFGSQHINSAGRNKTNASLYEKYKSNGFTTINSLTKELQYDLRKWNYSFAKSQTIIDKIDSENKEKQEQTKMANEEESRKNDCKSSNVSLEPKSDKMEDYIPVLGEEKPENQTEIYSSKTIQNLLDMSEDAILNRDTENMPVEVKNPNVATTAMEDKKLGPVSDQDLILTKLQEKKVIDWTDKLYLSPLTTVGNLPFRRICKEFGVDITCGEMAMGNAILRGMPPEWALVKRHVTEDLFGVQLCGNNPYVMTKSAQLLEERTNIDFVDVNLGCPIELFYKRGEGSGLLRRERVLGSVIQCMSRVLTIPLTVKTRTGVYMDKNIAHNLVPKFREWGASLITIHGRSREQRYTKSADWPYIEKCAQLATPVPVFLNGDILSFEDYERARKESPSVAGAMIGRGALIKPWIFTEIKERRHWDISSQERLDILKKYVNYGLEHWGSDTKGVENTRKFLLEWLSFLHRYIPIGVLERPPQRINERPPYYRGRDELETLMASTNCADWIKISEMLLGPVPENYNFLPKHKANSWK